MHSRRGFLLSLFGALAAAAGAMAAACGRGASARPPVRWRASAAARRIGAEYARTHPALDPAALRRALSAAGLDPDRCDPAALAACARRDFESGRIARVGGWMLAESEAQLCAFAYRVSA